MVEKGDEVARMNIGRTNKEEADGGDRDKVDIEEIGRANGSRIDIKKVDGPSTIFKDLELAIKNITPQVRHILIYL